MSAPQAPAPDGADHQVHLLGQDVRVRVRPGTEPGPVLLLCNGIGASLGVLQPFVDKVDPRIEVVSFDVPGVGGSAVSRVPYTFATLSCFLGKLLDHLGYREFDVLGVSWGGALAQQLAVQNPRRCRRVVLASTGTGVLMVPGHPKVLRKMITPRRYRDPEYAQAIAAELYGGRAREHPEAAKGLLPQPSHTGSRAGYAMQLLAGAGWTSLPFLKLLRQQTLILAGSDDPVIPLANARILHTLLPHARVHVYADGHLGLVTSADELGPLVSQFLRP